ncbi:MAG: LytTR family transcriptional regulator DNA-binding domain-containing protein, partial [Phaeodactylibacter sp.]|nr:LytTR family transcriptional regulator DNA-binding domain-containing protein [Phaeodactylibacter sp.]
KIEWSGDTSLLREFDAFRTLNLDLRKRTVQEEVEQARIEFETEKIALENQLLTQEKQLLQQSKTDQLIVFSLLGLLLLGICLVLLNRYRKEKAIRTDFELQNQSFLQKLQLFKQQQLSYEQLSKEQIELIENRKIPVADVIYISAHERGSIVQTVDGPKNHFYALKDWESTLADLGLFLRVHKSHILNLNHYQSRRYDKSTLVIELSNGQKIPVGRKYKEALIEQLDQSGSVIQS